MAANNHRVKRFIFLESCIIKSTKTSKRKSALNSKLEKTNEAYALAKISGIKLSEFYFIKKIGCDMCNAN